MYSLSLLPRLPNRTLEGMRNEFVVYSTKLRVSQYHLKVLEGCDASELEKEGEARLPYTCPADDREH